MFDKLNSFLYDSREKVINFFGTLLAVFTLAAFGLLIYDFGFPLTASEKIILRAGMDIVFGFYALNFFIKLLYSFDRISFLRNNWIEGLLMLFIVFTGVNNMFFDYQPLEIILKNISIDHYEALYRSTITMALLYMVGYNFVRASTYLNSLAIQPATTFALSFIVLIGLGAALLMMPEMTAEPGSGGFLESFFTSVSASCVTGLIVVDTGTYWSFKGQVVIMLLMQLGGIGLVSFATFFATFMKSGMGVKHQVIMQDFLNSESLNSARSLLRQIVSITVFFEVFAIIAIYFTWGNEVQFSSEIEKIYFSVFHGISAFCNAGFSLFQDGLHAPELRNSLLLHVIIGCAIIAGGIGFSVIQDVLSPVRLRERLEKPWKDWKLSSKIAVYSSFLLILSGLIVIAATEWNNEKTLGGMGYFERIIAAFFQSVTTRTAGFNTIDIGAMATPALLFMIFLMFIGASSGSTGGGIKTSTFTVITWSAFSTVRGRKSMHMAGRTITNELIFKAYSIFVFAATYNLVAIFILTISDPGVPVFDLVFEQISAFSTVGLSTGITEGLSVTGKIVLVVSMYVGRIGTLTLALALSTKPPTNSFTYPRAHLFIG